MIYTYRVDTLIPKSEFMSVTYMADGYPDYRRNFNPIDFSEENLRSIVEDFAPQVMDFWKRQESHPESAVFQGGTASAEVSPVDNYDPTHVPVIEPEPEFDPFTQYITLNQIEDLKQETVGWTVTDMTPEEQAEYLSEWRRFFSVTMSQFRLALFERGISEVEKSISSPDAKAKILWESSNFVRRDSERVAKALSMTDEELDEFFQFAGAMELTI